MKHSLLLTLATFVLPFVTGCQSQPKRYIGIVSAMENEIAVLLEEMKDERVVKVANHDFYMGTLHKKPVIITKTGIGKIRSSSVVTTLFDTFSITKTIFTGIAGGVKEETDILDEVIATRLVEHDYGIITNDGFVWKGGDPGYGDRPGEVYYCDEKLVNLAYDAAVEVVGAENVYKGTIATGDQFVASEQYVERLQREYDAYACEMEGASVAAVCEHFGIPYVVLRALSDKADGKAHESYADFGDIAAEHSSNIVLKMLESPLLNI